MHSEKTVSRNVGRNKNVCKGLKLGLKVKVFYSLLAFFSFNFDYVTGNRLENGTCGFKLPGFGHNADFLAGWEISRKPLDVT